ncbi:cytochrome c oxidase subunit I [Aetokthonos hydrillicola Thurmond2011]|jgi:cytochrome c oxidase subunit 1|uniref:Cytochrome c oxidase subunit 1 n=1 Tax=Aetokthonos hydrillicola Thurmond2011 TaxID=2712845 RepID=A0AAP5I2J6_9CYAN|nr:cytochrome c oxidase subunit I [Aetokthonos hydrillicola]MBO3458280.1 cytochrome c oxidase subunit I [Aetokthonos hydrillicola CCALA 1050]MBW4585842.1 cytochrome c oxidase subunit I [Aetokthonos hydrillicola CCALA 1050]MDR9893932.1 cytochrome c oxidase subunit I [Aetokthonos hydrillicola Thurmond2011]
MTNNSREGVATTQEQENSPKQNTNWREYFSFSTDHKVIGIQYIVTTFIFFLIGGLLAMIIRGELITPQSDVVDRPLYNALFTLHGTIMIFLWIIPFNAGLANYLVPLMIGARDMAFPKLNAIAFWMIPPGGLLLLSSFLLKGGAAQAGWWSYPPVSIQNPSGHWLNGEVIWIVSLVILGISSIMGGVNFITTIFWMRAPGMTFFRMPIFVWAVMSSQLLQLFCLPALTGGLILLFLDIVVGTNFFKPSAGGNPILYEHLFWFYSHPAVYVMVLPAFGIFSEIIPAFSRNPLFGYRSVAIATIGLAVISAVVWVHHLFASATPSWMRILFMFTSMLAAVPTGIKEFAWTATVWRGRLHLLTPMLFALGGVVMFLFAGITGVMLASTPFDLHVNNTYFVVGHFHYVVYNAITVGIFAAIYFWFPKITGRMYSEGWGKIHFWLTFIGANLTFFPMHPLGLHGMLRRVSSYDPEYQFWNVIASLGSFLLGMSVLPFIANIVVSALRGERAGDNPWHATGLEWKTSSPPPKENFDEIPVVNEPPYHYVDDEPEPSPEVATQE